MPDYSTLRLLVRETLLTEAALTPERAALDGLTFRAMKTRFGHGGWTVVCYDSSGKVGAINISRSLGVGKCLGAFEVTMSDAGKLDGLGPLLYDIAMELSGESGIMPDRKLVSPEARRVWRHYFERRPDVESRQLDSIPGVITPLDDEDDCRQGSAGWYVPDPERGAFASMRLGGDWRESPLSKAYRKRGTPVIDELRKFGVIEFV